MSALSIIRDHQLRQQRLFEAQKMMAKAYRGVSYEDYRPDSLPSNIEMHYRGSRYYRP